MIPRSVENKVVSVTNRHLPFNDAQHTGWQHYQENVTQIPTAAISIEVAEMLHRMFKAGDDILVYLYMEARNLPPVMSRNTIAEIVGHQQPDKVVLVSGHLDSWDVGQGAMDGKKHITLCSVF